MTKIKLYDLYETLLYTIEENITDENLTTDKLSNSLSVSSVHLQRLFKSAFDTTLASYIRSRRLAVSLEKLINSDVGIADIAVEHGFDYARSYIRAFKQEFGLTPGEVRKSRQIVKVKPPLQLFPSNKLRSGLLFGPEIVYVPGFFCVGRQHFIYGDSIEDPARVAREFWLNHKDKIPNIINPRLYIGLTKFPEEMADYTIYMPSVCVSALSHVPDGYVGNTVPTCLCARFRYIGEHHYMDINSHIAQEMYNAINAFQNDDEKYGLFHHGIFFERIDAAAYDGKYCTMEWFSPVYEK